MTRWNPKLTKDDVLRYFHKHPNLKSTEMARALKCSPAYIRATLARAGIMLARSRLKRPSLCGINQKAIDEEVESA